jgi:Ca-activated chloride channel family protein
MVRFAHIEYLWGLAAIPLLVLLFWRVFRWKKKAIAKLGDKNTVSKLMPEVSFSRPVLKFLLIIIAYAAMVVALADPQAGTKIEEGKRSGADLMILLDVSNSMLAGDLQPNRLENAKRAIAQLIDNLHEDRIGIIIFAGEAYVQLPVTTDYAAAKLFLDNISTDIVPTQGTAIGAAIELGMKSLSLTSGSGKAMILMTDGENHEDDAVAAAESARKKGVNIHVIGLGLPEGASIPILKDGKSVGVHMDETGKPVISKLNEAMCKEIATAGNGVYVRASIGNTGLNIVMNEVGKMQKSTFDSKNFKSYEDRFQVFLSIALILLMIEFFVSNRKNRKLTALKLFEVKKS